MQDLISRQAAIEIIQSMYPSMPRVPWMRKNWQKQYEPYIRTENAIRELSSAQPEHKKGKWIKMSDVDGIYWACSECGEDIPRIAHFNPQFDLFPRLESIDKTYFCPNCGAKMRGEDYETD